jgi:hypothetical protein
MNLYDLPAAQPPRDESGAKAAEELFDTAALLEVLDHDIDRMRGDGEMDEAIAFRWSRVLCVSVARLNALASQLTEASIKPQPRRGAPAPDAGGQL